MPKVQLFLMICTEILLTRYKCAIQNNNTRHLVVTAQQYEECVLTLIILLGPRQAVKNWFIFIEKLKLLYSASTVGEVINHVSCHLIFSVVTEKHTNTHGVNYRMVTKLRDIFFECLCNFILFVMH